MNKLELKIVDAVTDGQSDLILAGAVRGLDANDENWRHEAAQRLRGLFSDLIVHVGGHHIAVHEKGPLSAPRPDMAAVPTYGRCLGRVIESPVKKAKKVTPPQALHLWSLVPAGFWKGGLAV